MLRVHQILEEVQIIVSELWNFRMGDDDEDEGDDDHES